MLRWLAVAGDGLDESAWAMAFQTSCWGRSTGRPALSEPMKLPSEARIRRWVLVSFWAASSGPPLTPPRLLFCGNCAHCIKDALANVPKRVTAVRDAESSPGGSSSNALDVTTAERARAPPQPLLMVAKCSVMIGGHQVSSRRLLGRPVPKSDSAGSRRRPQHTRKSRAARAMTPA